MLTGHDIVCLSTQDWTGLWTRKQRFMQMFARNGNRVLYIETPVHLLGLDVLPQDPARLFRFLKGPRPIESGLHVATLPILLPFFQMFHSVNTLNHVLIRSTLRHWMRTLGFERPLLWIYTPFSVPLADTLKNSGVVYECVDEFRAARGFVRSKVIGQMEDALLSQVNLAVVTQENLVARRAAICRNTFCIPNGADTDYFKQVALNGTLPPPEIGRLPHPRLGLVGHIHYWIDLKLIRFLAERRPDWNFVLIGPISPMADIKAVKSLSNVHLLGRRPQSEIPLLLKGIDVCLNPYVRGSLANHASPLKLYEYLAAGKPVVSTDMGEAHKFPTEVLIANHYEEFLHHCTSLIGSLPESSGAVRRRMDLAAPHSWMNRFTELNELLNKFLPR